MTVIEPFFNNYSALHNMNDINPLCQNDGECRHQLVILVKAVNDAAPWWIDFNIDKQKKKKFCLKKSQKRCFKPARSKCGI